MVAIFSQSDILLTDKFHGVLLFFIFLFFFYQRQGRESQIHFAL